MAQSLFDMGAKSRGQRTRLKSIFDKKPEDDEDEGEPQSLFPGPDGGTQGEKPGGKGFDYGAMTPAEFNQVAQDRANSSFMGRNAPGALAGLALPGAGAMMAIGGWMDDRNFKDAQAVRSADFKGMGLASPDEDMMQAYGGVPGAMGGSYGGAAPGPSMADMNAATAAAAAADMDPNSFAFKGGKIKKPHPESLFGNVDPPGPDDVIIAAKTGERVLNAEQYASLSKEAKAEVDKAMASAKKGKPGRHAEGGVVDAPMSDADYYTSLFAARPDGQGPRGPGGEGFGMPEEMMAPMPHVRRDARDPMVITPELLQYLMRLKGQPQGV